jgi:hypothetical protein
MTTATMITAADVISAAAVMPPGRPSRDLDGMRTRTNRIRAVRRRDRSKIPSAEDELRD